MNFSGISLSLSKAAVLFLASLGLATSSASVALSAPAASAPQPLVTTQTPAASQGGVVIYDSYTVPGAYLNDSAEAAFARFPALANDIIDNNVSGITSVSQLQQLNFYDQVEANADGTLAGRNGGTSSNVDRACYDIDTSYGPGADAIAHSPSTYPNTAYGDITYGYDIDHYTGKIAANLIDCTQGLNNCEPLGWHNIASEHDHTRTLICTSYALPQPTLSLSTYTATPGQTGITLSWSDTAPRDDESSAQSIITGPSGGVPGPADPALIVGGTAVNGSSSVSNYGIPPNATCTASGFSNTGPTNGNWSTSASGYTWNPNATPTTGELKSGSVSITAPTQPGSYTYSYTCTNANGSTVQTATLTVPGSSSGSFPDLTAGNVAPTSAIVNVPVTLAAPVTNQGTAGTGIGFPDLFEINPTSIPTSFNAIQNLLPYSSTALGAGQENAMTVLYTFPSSGTYYVRACANTDLNNNHVVTESSYNDECGNWIAVSVAGGGPSGNPGNNNSGNNGTGTTTGSNLNGNGNVSGPNPNAVSALLTAKPLSVPFGLFSTLSWSSENTISCTGSPLDFAGGKTSGSINVFPLLSTLYTLTCEDRAGDKAYDSQNVTVTPPAVSINAFPTLVDPNTVSTISWSVAGNPTSCTVSGPNLYSTATAGSISEIIKLSSTYTISCIAGSFNPTQSVTVRVVPNFTEF